jgi:hypothetical protein
VDKRTAILFAALPLLPLGCGGSDANLASNRAQMSDDSLIVVSGNSAQRRIGRYHYMQALKLGRSYIAAVEVFGEPSHLGTDNSLKSNLCAVRWATRGVEAWFATSAPHPCKSSKLGRAAWFGSIASGSRWRTDRGLRLGAPESAIRHIYPRARLLNDRGGRHVWSIVRGHRGEFGTVSTLIGETQDGTLTLFRIPPNYTY